MKKALLLLASLLLVSCTPEEAKPGAPASPDSQDISWTCDRNSAGLSGQVDGIGKSLSKKWERKLPAGIYSSGVMSEGKLYLADEAGQLHCLQLSDGSTLWTQALPQPVFSPLLLHEGVLYFGDTHGSFHAFDLATRSILWTYSGSKEKISGGATLSPDGELILFGSYDFKLRALHRSSGELSFELKTGNYINGTPAISKGRAVVGGCDSYLRFINLKEAREEIKVKLGSYIPCSVATDESRAYATCYDGSVKAVDAEGNICWQYQGADAAYQCSPSVNSHSLIAAEQNGAINIIAKASGELKGTVTVAGDIALAPLVDEERAIIADEDGVISIIELKTASIISQYPYGTVISAPMLLQGGLLLICDEDGQVSCFQMKE